MPHVLCCSSLWLIVVADQKQNCSHPHPRYHRLTQIYQWVASLGCNYSLASPCFRTFVIVEQLFNLLSIRPKNLTLSSLVWLNSCAK